MSLLIYTPTVHRYPEWRKAFAACAPDLTIRCGLEEVDADVEYVLAWQPPPGFLATLPNLKAIFSMGAGIDHISADPELPDVPLIRQRDAGMGAQMAEYALYAALHYQRDFDRMRLLQQARQWEAEVSQVRPRLRAGILGLGTLGAVVARSLIDNGFAVSGWARSPKDMPGVACFAGEAQLAPFLSNTELLICLLPDTPATRGLINAKLLQQLPRGAAVVNVARGALVVDEDLLAALDDGHLRGAMLDVFNTEPLPVEHRYWQHPKVVLTPHVAAETVYSQSAQQVSGEIARLQQGLPPSETVDLARGY